MRTIIHQPIAATLIFIASCTGKISIPEFNSADWQKDKGGCIGLREQIMGDFVNLKDKFINLSEKELLSIMGKPDRNELKSRGQKFFYYYYSKGGQCTGNEGERRGKEIFVRLSALNKVTEINYSY